MISRDDVLTNLEKLLANNETTNNNIYQLIEIMGGMDTVLRGYLLNTSLSFQPNKSQLSKINDVLVTIDQQGEKKREQKRKPKFTYNGIDSVLTVSKDDTILSQIFTKSIASQIINIIYSRVATVLCVMFVIAGTVINFIPIFETTYIIQMVIYAAFIFYLSFVLLSLNRAIVKEIVLSFEFWFKSAYFVRYIIAEQLILHNEDATTQSIVCQSFGESVIFLFLWFFWCVDALQMSYFYEAIVMTFSATYCVIYSVKYEIDEYWHHDHDRCDVTLGVGEFSLTIDACGWYAESWRILTLFVCMQTFRALYKRNKARLVKTDVEINWT